MSTDAFRTKINDAPVCTRSLPRKQPSAWRKRAVRLVPDGGEHVERQRQRGFAEPDALAQQRGRIRCNPHVAVDPAVLLRQTSHVVDRCRLRLEVCGHRQHGPDRDDAGAADTGDHHVEAPRGASRRRGDRQRGSAVCCGAGGAFRRPPSMVTNDGRSP